MNLLGRLLDRYVYEPADVPPADVAGEPAKRGAGRGWIPPMERIGPQDCPIIYRWTLREWGKLTPDPSKPERMVHNGPKLLLHRFPGYADDRDPHDHPRGFWTFILAGYYWDITAKRTRKMRPGMAAWRPAEYQHITRCGREGAWSVVLMWSLKREWGFWREGRFWPWRLYEEHFGMGMRCE